MATDDALLRFVRVALERGLPRPEIQSALLGAGWPREQVDAALSAYAELPFPIPVPRPKPYVSASDAFLYLVLFSTLYISAFNLARLLFSFIELALPEPTEPLGYAGAIEVSMRWSLAWLVIAFPVFLFVARFLARALAREPLKRASRIRKWLTYLTLFLAASVLLGDLATLVYSLLAGELGLRFALKVLAIAVIAGAVFAYYLGELRSDEAASAP